MHNLLGNMFAIHVVDMLNAYWACVMLYIGSVTPCSEIPQGRTYLFQHARSNYVCKMTCNCIIMWELVREKNFKRLKLLFD